MALVAIRRFPVVGLRSVRRPTMVEELRRSLLFSGASDRELRKVARSAEVVAVPADHRVMRQGDRVEEMFIVVSGRLAMTDDSRLVRVVGPDSWFGAMPLLRRGRSDVAVVTLTPCRLICLGSREFAAFADAVPGFAARLLADVARGNITPLDTTDSGELPVTEPWADDRRCG